MALLFKFFLGSILIFLIGFTDFFEPFRRIGHFFSSPIQYGLYGVSKDLKGTVEFFFNIGSIRSENLRLLEEKQELYSKLAQYKELENENKVLKEQLGFTKNSEDPKLLVAKVIGLPFDNENSELLIDKGSEDGVVVGASVVYKNYLVGSVVDLFPKRSVVVLTTSPKLFVAALNQSKESRAKGLVTGRYGTSLVMDRILPDEEIGVGDEIITSGQDGIFEPGLILGKVTSVENIQSEPLKKAVLKVEIDFTRLERVFVLLKEGQRR